VGVLSFVTDYRFDAVDVPTFFTLILLEAALSFDNAAVLAAVVRQLPAELRRKALLYGLGGAYLFRIVAILAVAVIIQNPWLKLVGGAYLVYLMLRHLLSKKPHEDAAGAARAERRFFGLSAFWSVVITVEVMDIAFALDQVTAAVGLFTGGSGGDKRLLIILASMVAILLLRISAYYVGKLMDWFPRLETFAYVAVGWVGLKLIAVEVVGWWVPGFDVPKIVSVGVTMVVLVLPVAVKAALDLARRRGRASA
jgi:YkoY family integral membrane protein